MKSCKLCKARFPTIPSLIKHLQKHADDSYKKEELAFHETNQIRALIRKLEISKK